MSLPVVVTLTERTRNYLFDDKSISLLLIDVGQTDAALELMEKQCSADTKYVCVKVGQQNRLFESIVSFLGAEELSGSELLILNTKARKLYRYKGKVAEITGNLNKLFRGQFQRLDSPVQIRKAYPRQLG